MVYQELFCTLCGRKYLYHHNDTTGHTKIKCNSCLVNQRRFAFKIKAVEYKGGKCIKCGYNRCIQALDFHHRNPAEKVFNLSGAHARSWAKVQQELDKCDLVCANCHREIESGGVV